MTVVCDSDYGFNTCKFGGNTFDTCESNGKVVHGVGCDINIYYIFLEFHENRHFKFSNLNNQLVASFMNLFFGLFERDVLHASAQNDRTFVNDSALCREAILVLSAYQEKIPARNAIYALAQDFSAGDELLLAILKAFIPLPLSKVSKSKAVPLHAMEAPGGRGGIAPTHSRPRH
jgi:hypothetical protein